MIKLPLNEVSLPHLALQAEGLVLFKSARRIIADEPFDAGIGRGTESVINVAFDLPGASTVQLGNTTNVFFEAGAEVNVDLLWHDEEEEVEKYEAYGFQPLDEDHVYLILKAKGEARAGIGSTFPTGPFVIGIKAEAGGNASCTVARRFRRNTPAGDMLASLLKGFRLPYSVPDHPLNLPAPGEVLAFEYGGYLSVGASLGWGFAATRRAGVSIGDLALESTLNITSSLSLNGGVDVAGDFRVAVRRGEEEGWARVAILKKKSRAFTFSGGLSVGLEVQTVGLPDDANKMLEYALGLRMPQVVRDLHPVLGMVHDPDQFVVVRLQKNTLLKRYVGHFTEKVLQKVVNTDTAASVFQHLKEAIALYDDLSEKKAAILEMLVEENNKEGEPLEVLLGRIEQILAPILKAADIEALKAVQDPNVWAFLKRFVGEEWLEFLMGGEMFEQVRDELSTWAGEQWEKVVALTKARVEALGLHTMLGDLDAFVNQLRKVDEPEAAVHQAEAHLLALAERMTDRALDTITDKDELKRAARELEEVIDELDGFKNRLYDRFKKALNGTHRMEVAFTFSRSRENTTLIDLAFDVRTEQGRALMRRVMSGDCTNLFLPQNLSVMKVHEGVFTHQTTSHRELKLDFFGWSRSSFRTMVVKMEDAIRQEGDGLFHIYTLTAEEEVGRKGKGEEIKMNVVLGMLAEGTRKDMVDTVRRLTAEYYIGVEDSETSEHELLRYLTLAQELGLLTEPPNTVLDDLRKELGMRPEEKQWGKVSLKYEVRYPPEVLLTALTRFPKTALRGLTRLACSRIVGGSYMSFFKEGEASSFMGRGSMWHYRIARLLLAEPVVDTLRRKGTKFFEERVPRCWDLEDGEICIGGPNDHLSKVAVWKYVQAERSMEEALLNLKALLLAGEIHTLDLRDAVAQLVNQRRDLASALPKEHKDRFTDPFFAVFDQLVQRVSGLGKRQSVLGLSFSRQQADEEVRITRLFTT